jgi:iron complex outermembrane recepter protein
MKITSALGLLPLVAAGAAAQTIQGTVTAAGSPVVGATVRLLELDRAERTGSHGEFRFARVAHGTYRVYVGVTGYVAVTDTVRLTDATASLTVNLSPSAIPLKEIVVSASPTAKPADEEYAPVESKDQVDLDNTAGATFAEKINDLPGVNARWNGSAAARPILRGLGDQEVLVLENGLRMGDIATFDPAHATPIDALSITQVDVVRGPATLLYGSSTIGGVVNVITNLVPTPSDHPLSGTGAFEGNSVSSEYAGYTNTVFTSGGSAFHVSAGGLHATDIGIPAGIYPDPVSGMPFALHSIPASDSRTAEEGTGYSYTSDFGMIGIGGRHFDTDYGIPGLPPNANWINVPPTTSRIHQQRNTGELRGLFNTGSSVFDQIKLDASYNDYLHSEFPTLQDSSGVSAPQANHFHKIEFNGILQLQQHPIGNLTGTIGLFTDIQDLTIEGQQPLGPNSRTTDAAAYAFEEYALSSATRLQAGVRYDWNKIQTRPYPQSQDTTFETIDVAQVSNAVTASVGAIQQLGSGLSASLSVDRSFRAPTVQELFANGLDASSNTYSIGDASLTPEVGYGIDAAFKGSYSNAVFALTPFVNIINHYIYGYLTGDTIQGFPVRQFTSSDARLWGFELAGTVSPVQNIALHASSDYVNATNTQLDIPLPFIPPLRGLLRATYQDETYMGMIEWRGAAAQTRLGQGDTPTSGYGIYNTGVGIRVLQGGVVHNISLHLDNVLNRRYYDAVSVIKTWVGQPGRGLRLNYELLY